MRNIWLVLLTVAAQVLACTSGRVFAQDPEKAVPPEIAKAEAAVRSNPFAVELRLRLGVAYMDKGDFSRAIEVLQEAVRLAPASAEAHNWLGVALMGKSDMPGAVSELRKAVSLDPKYARGYTNLGSALARSGDTAQAVQAFQKALTLEPDSVRAHLNLALALREKGDLKAALLHLRRVATAEPKNATVQYELGQTLRQSGDLSGAVAAFEKAVEINPELQEAYYGLGLVLKQQSAAMQRTPVRSSEMLKRVQERAASGDLDSARDQLLEIVRTDQVNAEAHSLLGYILGQQGQLEFARNHLQLAVQLKPDYADGHYNLGVALWYSGARKQAIPELKASVKLDPALGAAYAFLGMALREEGDLAGARVSLQRAIALFPPTTSTYVDLAIVFLRQGDLDPALGQLEAGLNAPTAMPTPDWDDAISGLRNALRKTPNRADVHNMLGLLLGRRGADREEVLAEFREAVKLRPDYAAAHNNMGLVLAQSDEDEKAVGEFREAIRIRPDYAAAHANLGATLLATDVVQAIPELEKAASLDPSSVNTQFNLAEAYGTSANHHGPAEQIEQLQKVIAISPSFARAHLALGKALLQTGKTEEAIAELRDAVRLSPQSGESHYQLGLALARAGKQQEATFELQKGRELSVADERNQNAVLDINEGRAALDKGELEQAAEKLRHALKLQPDSASAEHFLGVVLEKQGDRAGALEAFQKALELNSGDALARRAFERLALPDAPPVSANNVRATQSTSKIEAVVRDDATEVAELEAYIRQKRFSEAEPRLMEYLKQHPQSDWGWYALGYSQFAQKKIGESIKSLASSLQLNVKNAEAHKILGRDLMIIGQFDRAQTEFEQGIRYDPNSAEMHYNLGKLYSMQDNWQSARKEFELALGLDSSYAEALDALGFAQEALGDDAAAVASYQKAIALNEERHGTFVAPSVNLSAYYNRSGDTAKALEYAQKALNLDPKSDAAWFQRARAEERLGQLEQSVASLSQAIALNPRSSSYYYVLAGIYRRQGKTEDSQKALDSFTRLDRENSELEKMRRSMAKPAGAPHPGGERE
jgi:tetratricopeptide (TPR) repeat protein